jgi:hypothetical protein
MEHTCFRSLVAGLTARGTASGPTTKLKPPSLDGEGNDYGLHAGQAAGSIGEGFTVRHLRCLR